MSTNDTPSQIDARHFKIFLKENDLEIEFPSAHKPRILLLYGSLRERSFSRFLTLEADRLLKAMGADTRIFDPRGLPLPYSAPSSDAKVQELRDLCSWSEAQVWCSPERHGAISGILKAQIDWIPLSLGECVLHRERRWPLCKCVEEVRASTLSIKCGYWGVGCGC